MAASQIYSKKLSDIDNELERGVFLAAYHSSKQKRNRMLAGMLLGIKHGLRGLLFSWPLYLLPLAAFALPGQLKYLFIVLLLPGLFASTLILKKGVKEDYKHFVSNRLINFNHLHQLIFSKETHQGNS